MIMTWRKSSRSADAGQCVEVRNDLRAVRDSKNPDGPTLAVSLPPLLAALRFGNLDR
jgi:hypothetical protein